MAANLARFADEGWLNVVGGCCGTTAAHIRALARTMEGRPPGRARPPRRTLLSGIEVLEVDERPGR